MASFFCSPAGNRTPPLGSEDLRTIHYTTGPGAQIYISKYCVLTSLTVCYECTLSSVRHFGLIIRTFAPALKAPYYVAD